MGRQAGERGRRLQSDPPCRTLPLRVVSRRAGSRLTPLAAQETIPVAGVRVRFRPFAALEPRPVQFG